MPITLLGYVLAGGNNPITGVGWLLFGLLWHYVGFLQNNILDYEYDRRDPEKQHFPLVSGRIKLVDAVVVESVGLIVLAVSGLLLGGRNTYSTTFLIAGIVSGTLYNLTSKKTLLKPIPIAICFASLPAISYTSVRPPDTTMWLLFFAVFTTILYQIGFSGELKDIRQGERNILLRLGSLKNVAVYAIALKSTNIATILTLGYATSEGTETLTRLSALTIALLASILLIDITVKQLKDYEKAVDMTEEWRDRDKALKNMSYVEILTYITLIISLTPVLGTTSPLYILLPIAWFAAMNRIIFGTTSYPKV
ncbi:MAG: UbiA family prenyltransferase [Thermoproteota archaeon]